MELRDIFWNLGGLLFPHYCPVCGRALMRSEKHICQGCMIGLPRLPMIEGRMEDVEMLFMGAKSVTKAVSLFRYNRHSAYASIIKDIKYHNNPRLGYELAGMFATELLDIDWFDGVDMIIPVPLHRKKYIERGYNQSMYIANGISDVTGIPVVKALTAVKPHKSQTSQDSVKRRMNVKDVFDATDDVRGKVALIVDDVITTGATISACSDVLLQHGVAEVRALSLACASTY